MAERGRTPIPGPSPMKGEGGSAQGNNQIACKPRGRTCLKTSGNFLFTSIFHFIHPGRRECYILSTKKRRLEYITVSMRQPDHVFNIKDLYSQNNKQLFPPHT